MTGPGHGGPGLVASTWLEGSYTDVYPDITRDAAGMHKLFRQFSFPGGIPSHVAPETPGSIHEGGELGYALVHAYGAAFDNPELLVCCVVGDGEAETGPLAASWHSNKFVNPARDGAVLPVLHLNGYKIANPTVLARIPEAELRALLEGYGHAPRFVTGDDPDTVHQALAAELDGALDEIAEIQRGARAGERAERPRWPMIVLRTPKGWTGPKVVDGHPAEGNWRSHQVPLSKLAENPEHLRQLEEWMRSYRPEELFDEDGRPRDEELARARPGTGAWARTRTRTAARCLRDLRLPDFRDYAVDVPAPAQTSSEATRVLGTYLRDVMRLNEDRANFRVFGPDETASNRLGAVLEATDRAWMAAIEPGDDHLAPDGRVMEVLSEHLCQGWLEGYLLTGRHGIFNCYEAFIHIVDSMFNQHAKWLKVTRAIPWRQPIASLNYLLSSHVWRQDHNGFSHQDPGFIDHVVNKKAEIVRVYLPPDANCLLSVGDHCLRSRNYVNVIVAGKQPALDYLTIDEAIAHCTRGLGIWPWASNDDGEDPDVVLACAGETPTLEALAAVRDPARAAARSARPLRQRRRPDAPAGRDRASARSRQRAVRRAVHRRPAGDLRLPRLPVADPPAHLPAHEPPQPARARLQGGGHDHDAVRHGHAQRHGPLPPGDGRHRPRARLWASGPPACARRWSTSGCASALTRASTGTTRTTCATGGCRGR